ncbi:MAG: hypothetical protein ABSE90_13470 [Verrucomicrobiota bacterium]
MKTLLRRLLFGFLGLIGLVVLFYAEEDLRGWRAWENCKHELAAKGEVLDWDKYIPPPVPDDQNFFKAPKMAARFVKLPAMPNRWVSTNDFNESEKFSKRFYSNTNTTATITTEPAARDYLAWSDQFQPDFDLMREALKLPYARMDGDYSIPYQMPIPNFVAVRNVAQVLAQRAKCDLLLGQPDKALQELTLLHDMCRLMQAAPTGKPMTLVAAMINVAVTGLYVDAIAGGLQSRAWQEPQLAALQEQLKEINLTPFVLEALHEEPAAICRDAEIVWIKKMFDMTGHVKWTDRVRWWFWPRGWTYQNMVNVAMLGQKPLDGFDLSHKTIAPRRFAEASREVDKFFRHKSPYKLLAAIAIPNFTRAEQTTAHNQTMANEAQIVCALERYRLATGQYPATLDALSPQFIEKIPHDIIGGEPLIYRPTADGKFLLYSVGWNEKDDGGQDVSAKMPNGGIDFTKGDWVWKN